MLTSLRLKIDELLCVGTSFAVCDATCPGEVGMPGLAVRVRASLCLPRRCGAFRLACGTRACGALTCEAPACGAPACGVRVDAGLLDGALAGSTSGC